MTDRLAEFPLDHGPRPGPPGTELPGPPLVRMEKRTHVCDQCRREFMPSFSASICSDCLLKAGER